MEHYGGDYFIIALICQNDVTFKQGHVLKGSLELKANKLSRVLDMSLVHKAKTEGPNLTIRLKNCLV